MVGEYGELLAEVGQKTEAEQVLRRATQLAPEAFASHLLLGQLLEGEEGLRNTQRGVQILQQAVCARGKGAGELRAKLASGLCSWAESLLGGVDEVNAVAGECEALLAQAREADPSSPEPLQVLASLRVEQGRPDEALRSLRESMALWRRPGEVSIALQPSFEFRFETAKLIIELDTSTSNAVEILEELLEENDGVPDVYYVLAMAYYAAGQAQEALECIAQGQAVLEQAPDTEAAHNLIDLQSLIQRDLENT